MKIQNIKKNIRTGISQIFTGECSSPPFKKEVTQDLYELDVYKKAGTILGFMSMDDEISTETILKRILADKKALALPRILGTCMEFYYIRPDIAFSDQLETGSYKINEPVLTLNMVNKTDIDSSFLVLVPGRAFTNTGIRLGRGKAYYDIYFAPYFKQLKHKKPCFAGLCYEFQVVEKLPKEAHDIVMDYLITDKKAVMC